LTVHSPTRFDGKSTEARDEKASGVEIDAAVI